MKELNKEVIEYMLNDAGKEYHAPQKIDDLKIKKEMTELKKRADRAIFAFNEMINLVGERCKMICLYHNRFLDGTCRKTREYLWGELKTEEGLYSPESISVFIEKDQGNHIVIRVATEITEMYATSYNIDIHNDIVLANLPEGCIYVLNNKNNKDMHIYGKSDEAKELINSGRFRKAQICKSIALSENIKIDDIADLITKLLPVYNKMVKAYLE